MATVTDDTSSSGGESLSLRERGARTVRGLASAGRELFPLRERVAKGETLTEAEQQRLDELEVEYRALEARLFTLMRPREPMPWLRGADHAHGPDAKQEDH